MSDLPVGLRNAICRLAGAPENQNTRVSVDTSATSWSYSEYTGGTDVTHDVSVTWNGQPGWPRSSPFHQAQRTGGKS